MRIKSLKINNILSVKDIEVEFGDTGLVLLDGWNYDDSTANGAGKSAIFNALAFGLYGKMPRDITPADYLRKGSKAGFVEVTLDCAGEEWTIKRSRPTNLVITKNGQVETLTQEAMEAKYRLTYQQFLLTMYASQLKSDKFILLNDSGKKDFLLQLMNLDKFSEAKEQATKQLKDLTERGRQLDTQIVSLDTKVRTLKESLDDSQNVQERLDKCDTANVVEEINALASVPEPDSAQFQSIELTISQKRRAFDEVRIEIATLRRERDMVLRQRQSKTNAPIASCPHCNQGIVVAGKELTKSSDVETHNRLIDEANQAVELQAVEIAKKINELESRLLESKQLDELEQRVREKHQKKLSEYRQVVNRLAELRALKSSLEQEARYLRQRLLERQTIVDKIAAAFTEKQVLQSKRDELKKEELLLEVLGSIFSPVGVQAYVADMVLDRLNERVSDYMCQMWPNASYKLLSYKETKTGEVRAKFSEKIVIAGRERSLGALSGGELRCISLAVDLAVVDIVMQMFGVELNPLILDEPFDGMDNSNRERAIELLTKIAQTREIWVIDHSSEARAMFSRVVRVEKRNEVTSVI